MNTKLTTSLLLNLTFILFTGLSFAQAPSLSMKATKRILTMDDEHPNNVTKLTATFVPAGSKKIGTEWAISGTKDKDWEVISGSEKSENVELKFKKVGNYSVTVTTTYSVNKKLKNGETEEEENDVSVEEENYITVTNNLDELTQIHADSNFVKLVKKASNYVINPKYAGDPTPNIFLAKGYFGMYRKDIKDAAIQDPYEEAIAATAAAVEMDQNGVFYTPVHKMWLNGFQNEILNNGVLFKLEEDNGVPIFYTGKDVNKKATLLEEMVEGVDQYSQITKNPIAIKFVEAAVRVQAKDTKNANLIWKTEIPNLMKMDKIDKFTDADKIAFKTGILLSAQAMIAIDKNNTRACELLNKAKTWFEDDKQFIALFEKQLNSCKTQ